MEVPTKAVKISTGQEVKIKEWITQEQEDELNRILLGSERLEVGSSDLSLTVSADQIIERRKKLISYYCEDLTWEDFNVLSPKDRKAIEEAIMNIVDGEEKKKE